MAITKSAIDVLARVLAQEDTVLFVGSGISTWSGLPSWPGLIEELAKFLEFNGQSATLVRNEAARGDFLQAASYAFHRLTAQQICQFVRSASRVGQAAPCEIHEKIVSLGPRCYVTTNYDDLLEQSLRIWKSDYFFPPPVTNRHLVELASIVHARAKDFIFKPHGDAGDCNSIILTREQYRTLLVQGERHAALETLKTLLVSRPVVYLGFGLRDPDFQYIRDILTNIYTGGTRDHYAIMPDVDEQQVEYWRHSYGIHLFGYCTKEGRDGRRDHAELLEVLSELASTRATSSAGAEFDPATPAVQLSLARYAAATARIAPPPSELSIRVELERSRTNRARGVFQIDRFNDSTVEELLGENGPARTIILGLPGAGKTHSLRRASGLLSESLHQACLASKFGPASTIVPVLVDLKLYRGDVLELITQNFPPDIPFDALSRHFKVKIFLDAFNEMPREYIEKATYEVDFTEFLKRFPTVSLVIASRTSDGLEKFELPTYSLAQIDYDALVAELGRLGVAIQGRFSRELRDLLRRPFFLRYLTTGAVTPPIGPRPVDFYRGIFDGVQRDFAARFRTEARIERALGATAFNALNRGLEAFPLGELRNSLDALDSSLDGQFIDPMEVANWLVSKLILVPYSGGRVAFVHQSITEYLAATELALRYQTTPKMFTEQLSLTRWDQAIFLTLSLLPGAAGEAFLESVIHADFGLALSAAKYLESDVEVDRIVGLLLTAIPNQPVGWQADYRIESALERDLPLTTAHLPQLRILLSLGGALGGAAAKRLVELTGGKCKDDLLELLVERSDDYNFCVNGIARALKHLMELADVPKLASWADSLEESYRESQNGDAASGFIPGCGALMSELDISAVRAIFITPDAPLERYSFRGRILCDLVESLDGSRCSTATVELLAELLLSGVDEAAFALHLLKRKVEDVDPAPLWSIFSEEHVSHLEALMQKDSASWAILALLDLCKLRQDLAELVRNHARTKRGIYATVLEYCAAGGDSELIFSLLSELEQLTTEARSSEPVRLLQHISLDWSGKEALLVRLLRLRDIELARSLFGGASPPMLTGLGEIDIGSIDWWLEWIVESDETDEERWFTDQLIGLLSDHAQRAVREAMIREANNPESRHRRLLLLRVLPRFNDLSTDEFSEDSISLLLADLTRRNSASSFRGHALGACATEQFAVERLVPLLAEAKEPFLGNLRSVLDQAGRRHGRRYVLAGT